MTGLGRDNCHLLPLLLEIPKTFADCPEKVPPAINLKGVQKRGRELEITPKHLFLPNLIRQGGEKRALIPIQQEFHQRKEVLAHPQEGIPNREEGSKRMKEKRFRLGAGRSF